MAAISGFGGSVLVGSATLPVGRWTVNIRGEMVDTSTFEHGLMHDYALVGREYEVTLDAFWDTNQNPFSTPLFLVPGGTAPTQTSTQKVALTLRFCRADTTTRIFSFVSFLVENVSVDSEVRGVVKYSLSGRATRDVTFAQSAPASTAVSHPTLPGPVVPTEA